MGEQFFDKYCSNIIGINKDFLNEFLADCDAEYLKVFLFLHWKGEVNQTIETIADYLNLTESDVIKAIKYWVNHNVLDQNILYRLTNKITNIIKINSNDTQNNNVLHIENNFTSMNEDNNSLNNNNISSDKNISEKEINEGVDFLVNQTEILLKSPVTLQHQEFYKNLFTNYGFDKDMILKLITYCMGLGPGKKNINYMQAVADSWRQEGVKSIDDINAILTVMSKKTDKATVKPVKNTKKDNASYDEYLEKWRNKGFGV